MKDIIDKKNKSPAFYNDTRGWLYDFDKTEEGDEEEIKESDFGYIVSL